MFAHRYGRRPLKESDLSVSIARRVGLALAFKISRIELDQFVVLPAEKRVGARLLEQLQTLGYDFAGAHDFRLVFVVRRTAKSTLRHVSGLTDQAA